jgi:LmbE family N-acetylglucosaminyl deacetylase
MIVLAIAAHPDDIEMVMAGTLLKLISSGAEAHMWNLASGSCGTTVYSKDEIVRIRHSETEKSAKIANAFLHLHLVDDLEIFYDDRLLRKVAAVIRQVKPSILLVPSFDDYMEDHSITAQLAVTAAFARGMPNYRTIPEVEAWSGEVAIYHAQPSGNQTSMGEDVHPYRYVNVEPVLKQKRAMLMCHQSQVLWLDESQGVSSLENEMERRAKNLGQWSGRYVFAEGWRPHSRRGFSSIDFDPMGTLLSNDYWDDTNYKK